MAPEPRVLDKPTSNTIETAHQLLDLTKVADLSEWFDEELVNLEEKFARFRIKRKFLAEFRS